jgi:hypothetical protein
MNQRELTKIRREAESAVADMADGELKVKAFEVFLNHLLRPKDNAQNAQTPSSHSASRQSKKQPTKRVVAASKTERILSLKSEDYFSDLRTIGEVRSELASRGWHYPLTALSGPLQELVQRRELRRQKMPEGKKKLWKYSNP